MVRDSRSKAQLNQEIDDLADRLRKANAVNGELRDKLAAEQQMREHYKKLFDAEYAARLALETSVESLQGAVTQRTAERDVFKQQWHDAMMELRHLQRIVGAAKETLALTSFVSGVT